MIPIEWYEGKAFTCPCCGSHCFGLRGVLIRSCQQPTIGPVPRCTGVCGAKHEHGLGQPCWFQWRDTDDKQYFA